MAPFVVRFMLLPSIVLLIPTGALVLLYRYTHYTSRGGRSGHGSNCGSFSVNTNDTVSGTLWGLGAALL